MKHVRSDDHVGHSPTVELAGGELVEPFERIQRWDHIVQALESAGFGEPVAPDEIDVEVVTSVHDHDFVGFLQEAWTQWKAAGNRGDAIPSCFPTRGMNQTCPDAIDGRLGFYAFAAETAITEGTWSACLAAARIAVTAQQLITAGEPSAFALCRPPGHHAGKDYFGGYCFLNNAAIAAQGFLNDGANRVAVLDIDFHHGNGTQDIFYDRDDVLYASIHGDPRFEFPYFAGYAGETGTGPGDGFNFNYPMLPGTTFAQWHDTLKQALKEVQSFNPDALVVSLGVDTFEADPISSFKLTTPDFLTCGQTIGELRIPTLYCMEGGYAISEIGTNTVNVLLGDGQVRGG